MFALGATLTGACRAGAPTWIRDDMILIPGGEFAMGSDREGGNDNERPAHRVVVASFQMDRTEVTVRAYRDCVEATSCSEPEGYHPRKGDFRVFCNWGNPEQRDNHPINCVDFHQAQAFCTWAGKRLPTEEEWEYAARGAGEDRLFPWGNAPPTEQRLNACGGECPAHLLAAHFPAGPSLYPASDGWPETAPVGSFPSGASKQGVVDMAGNVWEWTASTYRTYDGAKAEAKRVLRGGSWGGSDGRTERTTNRFRLDEKSRGQFLGFRCAR
jgi:formylglycine-generating enzyme required for sulfatase activity